MSVLFVVAIGVYCLLATISLFVLDGKKLFYFNLFCYTVLLIAIVNTPSFNQIGNINLTLLPFASYNLIHTIDNILLFVPLGYFYKHCFAEKTCVVPFVVALAMETAQLFIIGRVFDVNDIYANFVGVAMGSLLSVVAQLIERGKQNEIRYTRHLFKRNQL